MDSLCTWWGVGPGHGHSGGPSRPRALAPAPNPAMFSLAPAPAPTLGRQYPQPPAIPSAFRYPCPSLPARKQAPIDTWALERAAPSLLLEEDPAHCAGPGADELCWRPEGIVEAGPGGALERLWDLKQITTPPPPAPESQPFRGSWTRPETNSLGLVSGSCARTMQKTTPPIKQIEVGLWVGAELGVQSSVSSSCPRRHHGGSKTCKSQQEEDPFGSLGVGKEGVHGCDSGSFRASSSLGLLPRFSGSVKEVASQSGHLCT